MVIIASDVGPGGGQRGGSAGALTIGDVTRPFGFEGRRRAVQADQGIDRLREKVDTQNVIPNDRLLSVSDDCSVMRWDPAARTGAIVCAGHTGAVKDLHRAEDGALWTTGADRSVRRWEAPRQSTGNAPADPNTQPHLSLWRCRGVVVSERWRHFAGA